MTEELERKIFERFKMFHPERPITEALMALGFEHGDGWFQLVWDLCEDLEKIAREEELNLEVFQVKEKFGALRFYIDEGTEAIFERINKAEWFSMITCEVCGKPGSLKSDGWVRTLCEDCRK